MCRRAWGLARRPGSGQSQKWPPGALGAEGDGGPGGGMLRRGRVAIPGSAPAPTSTLEARSARPPGRGARGRCGQGRWEERGPVGPAGQTQRCPWSPLAPLSPARWGRPVRTQRGVTPAALMRYFTNSLPHLSEIHSASGGRADTGSRPRPGEGRGERPSLGGRRRPRMGRRVPLAWSRGRAGPAGRGGGPCRARTGNSTAPGLRWLVPSRTQSGVARSPPGAAPKCALLCVAEIPSPSDVNISNTDLYTAPRRPR